MAWEQRIDELLEIAADWDSSPERVGVKAGEALSELQRASPAVREQALARLAEGMPDEPGVRCGIVATLCGALVESGARPDLAADAIMGRLEEILALAGEFIGACAAEAGPPGDEPAGGADDPSPGGEAYDDRLEQAKQRMHNLMPQEGKAWLALDFFWRAAIALLARQAALRQSWRRLREPAARLSEHHEAGHWLERMLSVLDDEPALVIEPARRRGIAARLSGIAENFQLHMLLMDALPDKSWLPPFSRTGISPKAVRVAQGEGPLQLNETVVGRWNLYTWRAVSPDGRLPEASDSGSSREWIWNEGTPADIPVFQGRRVILLGPASYPRSWMAQRMFAYLPAKIEVERRLEPAEIKDWLQRMAQAQAPAPDSVT